MSLNNSREITDWSIVIGRKIVNSRNSTVWNSNITIDCWTHTDRGMGCAIGASSTDVARIVIRFPTTRWLASEQRRHNHALQAQLPDSICIAEKLHSSINKLFTEMITRIAECTIDFSVHSAGELDTAIKSISAIEGVDEVHRVDIE